MLVYFALAVFIAVVLGALALCRASSAGYLIEDDYEDSPLWRQRR